MGGIDWIVSLAGLAGIAWVWWYFFVAGRVAATASAGASGEQAVRIAVHGGYEPATVRVKAGVPVRLTFDRQETSSCSEEVVFPDFGVRTFLPAFQRTDVVITPPAPGTYAFTCGMSMLHGRVVAE
jgi:plastocyanin domain-containing protein